MDYKYINQLLERYWKCETSLEEEEILRTFFSQDELPAELKPYKPLFIYEQAESKNAVLGEEFDQKVMSLLEEEYSKKPNKTKLVSLTERLKPLFKAAAIVAMILTLGNAAQVPFQEDSTPVETDIFKPTQGASVAIGIDSASIDTMQHTSIDKMSVESVPTILK